MTCPTNEAVESDQGGLPHSHDKVWPYFLLVVLFVLSLWVALPYGLTWWIGGTDWAKTGVFSDIYSAVNALFAGLAFGCLVVAIFLQKTELALQRRVLEKTLKALDEQRQQLQSQAESLRKQTFESTFLQLLRVLNEVRDTATYWEGGHPRTGEEGLTKVERRLRTYMPQASPENVQAVYEKFLDEKYVARFVWRFVGIISEVLEFIDNSNLEEKVLYVRLVRTVLSPGELAIMFYHHLGPDGSGKAKALIEKHGLFAHLPKWVPQNHRGRYDSSAFEDKLHY